jgi:hypothetical protein
MSALVLPSSANSRSTLGRHLLCGEGRVAMMTTNQHDDDVDKSFFSTGPGALGAEEKRTSNHEPPFQGVPVCFQRTCAACLSLKPVDSKEYLAS